MAMPDPGRDLSRPSLKGQKFMGYVVENDDTKHPDGMKRQRVQMRIPALDGNVEDKDLPWVTSQHPMGGGGNAGDGQGSVNVPAINAKFYVHFESEDPHTRFYGGSPPTDEVNQGNELLDMDYPQTYGGVDQGGNQTAINTVENTKSNQHVSGQQDHTAGDGTRTITSPTAIHLVTEGEVVIKAGKGIKFHAGAVLSLKGSRIMLNSRDATVDAAKVPKRKRPKPTSRTGQTKR